jgi:trigger factor
LLEVEVDSDIFEKSMDKAYRKLAERVNVPGFRKGKTPRPILEKHIGRGRILEEAIDIAVPDAYNQAIEAHDVDAIGQPSIELVSAEPLSFKATVPVRPTVELGDYKSIRIERKPVEVDEAEVEESLQELRRRYAIHEPAERPVQTGDIVRADVRIEVDGNEVFKDDDVELHLREGRTVLLPGFAEAVVGAVKGEPKTVQVTLPEDESGPLSGKAANIEVLVKEVKEERLPEVNDELAQQAGEGFPNVDALMERLRGDIRERLVAQEEGEYQDKAVEALVENAEKIEFPPVLVDREVERFLEEQARHTGLDLERYFELTKQDPAKVREDLKPSATERIKRSLALGRLADDEQIEVEEADIDAEVERIINQATAGNEEQAERYRKVFGSAEARGSLARSLLTRKTVERLIEITSQTDGAAPVARPAKKKEPAGAVQASQEEEP